MQIAQVLGPATSTIKHESMVGSKLLVVQPKLIDGGNDGGPLVVVDGVGAGKGQQVLISSDGRAAREMLQVDKTPVRWTVIGIQDDLN
ncbi:MAG: EutN/CcmL family microcompartment protein [Pirellulaceae bacterium]|jgi:ethanolamine utilization protein EutN|nr:EutN/CcmL family microcompartment protein [Pirellulaceae bacterium]MDP7019414.1 EutN/CcmL family microcompartment protein [Pirellulaceae bacterium]